MDELKYLNNLFLCVDIKLYLNVLKISKLYIRLRFLKDFFESLEES